ncbi:hypothetical protein Lfu02_75990 [Longispora fulva]|uniref:Uncharacterized protein n=1 Tax=Longispora fulva TaxID=619741 RepID=A0A8J7GE94_9ACTN|nr:hypothetical protein [Longispora fulva]MBG6136265.1 hypothetical protein [Longispora fulva]GIG63227.1 hypothetical protein Lfu02_75990 [Longispora fulva]
MTDPQYDADQEMVVLPALLVYRDTAPGRFVAPTVASVEAAGRRRKVRNRVAVAAGVAAMLVVGGVGVAVAGQRAGGQTPPGTFAASTSPTQTSPVPVASSAPNRRTPLPDPTIPAGSGYPGNLPEAAMLQPEDVGQGVEIEHTKTGNSITSYGSNCGPGYEVPLGRLLGRFQDYLRDGKVELRESVTQAIGQTSANRLMDHWEAFGTACSPPAGHKFERISVDTVGDRSVTWKITRPEGVTYHLIFQVYDYTVELIGNQEQIAALAGKAASRVCVASEYC